MHEAPEQAADDAAAPLREAWYYAAPSRALRPARLFARTMLGEPVLIGRTRDGAVFALRDICPHRGMPLSAGAFDGAEIECCYHGWRFDSGGRCTAIPALAAHQPVDTTRIAVRRYKVREVQGNVWVYFGDDPAAAPEVPVIDGLAEATAPRLVQTMRFAAALDHAVSGLVDPAHVPFVHSSWWWRSPAAMRDKVKTYAPSPFGFTMTRHAPSGNSRAYRLLGGTAATEIIFTLPGVRIEHIRLGRHVLAHMTVMTPIDAVTTEVNHCIYWTMPGLTALKPLLRLYARAFLRQDRDILERQQQGLRHDPPLLLVGDPDAPARWYYRLKREYRLARAEARPFANPVKPRTLRWRS